MGNLRRVQLRRAWTVVCVCLPAPAAVHVEKDRSLHLYLNVRLRVRLVVASFLAAAALLVGCGGDSEDELQDPIDPLANAYRNTSIAATDDPRIPMIAVHENGDHMVTLAEDARLVGAAFLDADGNSFTVWTDDSGRPSRARANSPDIVFVFGNYTQNTVDGNYSARHWWHEGLS